MNIGIIKAVNIGADNTINLQVTGVYFIPHRIYNFPVFIIVKMRRERWKKQHRRAAMAKYQNLKFFIHILAVPFIIFSFHKVMM